MDLTQSEAESIALAYLNSRLDIPDDELILQRDKIHEKEYGWFFLSTNRKYQETGDFRDLIVGNGWLLVIRRTGAVVSFSTAYSLENCIDKYKRDMGP